MQPTTRARELALGVQDGLERISRAVGPRPFVAADATRTFRIAATDNIAITVLPHLVRRIATEAPHVNLNIFPVGRLDVIRELDNGRLDFVLGWFGDLPDRMRRTTVTTDNETIVVRTGHPLTTAPVTKARLLSFPHIVVELTGSEAEANDGFLDDRGVFRRVWIERLLIDRDDDDHGVVGRVAISVPHYSAVGPMLLVSDLVATLPRRLASASANQGGLVMLDLPYEPLAVPVEACWHQRSDRDPGIQWLIALLQQAMMSVD